MNQNDPIGAEADLMTSSELPRKGPSTSKDGELRLAQRRYPDAESLFRQALQRIQTPSTLSSAWFAWTNNQQTRRRRQLWLRSKSAQSGVSRAIPGPIRHQLQQKKPEMAEAPLNRVLELDKNKSRSHVSAGSALRKQKVNSIKRFLLSALHRTFAA